MARCRGTFVCRCRFIQSRHRRPSEVSPPIQLELGEECVYPCDSRALSSALSGDVLVDGTARSRDCTGALGRSFGCEDSEITTCGGAVAWSERVVVDLGMFVGPPYECAWRPAPSMGKPIRRCRLFAWSLRCPSPSHLLISPDNANPHQGYLLSITDRTAASHILSTHTHQSGTYPKPPGVRAFFDILVGRGVIWAEGTQHTRQRRTLAPAFAIGALREMTEVFVDCAAKAAKRWEEMLTGSEKGMVTVDVQAWANHISYVPCVAGRELLTAYRLDSIGLAGFSHDFETLTATQKTPLAAALDAFTDSTATTSFTMFAIKTLTMRMPWVFKLPSQRNKTIQEARRMLGEATKSIWADLKSSEGQDAGKTILGVLRELRNCRWVRCSMCGRSGWSEPEPFGRRDCGRGVFSR